MPFCPLFRCGFLRLGFLRLLVSSCLRLLLGGLPLRRLGLRAPLGFLLLLLLQRRLALGSFLLGSLLLLSL